MRGRREWLSLSYALGFKGYYAPRCAFAFRYGKFYPI
jgi:hypothetical protein